MAALRRLQNISEATLWDTSNDFLESSTVAENTCSWGRFQGLERVTFGNRSDTYFRIQGVIPKAYMLSKDDSHSGEASTMIQNKSTSEVLTDVAEDNGGEYGRQKCVEGFNSEGVANQLVLQCQSVLSSGIYCRLMKRCLTATVKMADSAGQRSEKSFPSSSSSSFSTSSSSSSSSSSSLESRNDSINTTCWVSGGGAAEMGWSSLWGLVSHRLTGMLQSRKADKSSNRKQIPREGPGSCESKVVGEVTWDQIKRGVGGPPVVDKEDEGRQSSGIESSTADCADASDIPNSRSFREVITPLADLLSEALMNRIVLTHRTSPQAATNNSLESEGLSTGCVKAVQSCIKFCTLLSHSYAEIPRQLLINASYSASTTKMSRKTELIWRTWCNHYEQNSALVSAEYSTSPKNVPGRLGLISPLGKKKEKTGSTGSTVLGKKTLGGINWSVYVPFTPLWLT
jgi:hypothetical protein